MPYQWFVEPLDDDANDAIANFIGAAENSGIEVDEYGGIHNVWQCSSYRTVAYLLKSLGPQKIRVYNREKNYGPIRQWRFAKRKTVLKKRTK